MEWLMMQVGPPPPWLNERKPDDWKPRDVANAVLIDRSDLLPTYSHHQQPLHLVLFEHLSHTSLFTVHKYMLRYFTALIGATWRSMAH